MNALQLSPTHTYTDLLARMEYRKRVRELDEFAASEGLALPMPAPWIATLEGLGYVVDLASGTWESADGVRYSLTDEAQQMLAGGA
jgi:hypothetical protein